MKQVLHAEWTKLRTAGGNSWLAAAVAASTIGLSAAVAGALEYSAGGGVRDIAKLSLTGVYLGQVAVAVLAVLAIGGEYDTGMIRVTFAAMPRRTNVLAAKALIVSAIAVISGSVAVGGSLLAGRLLLPGNGYTSAHGFATLSLADGPTARAAVGSVLYLVLIGILSLGVATAVRDSRAAIAVVLGLLYLFPIVTQLITNASWKRHLEQIAPMTAGLAIQATTDVATLPIGPWTGLGVLAAWAVGALLVGGLLLHRRDA